MACSAGGAVFELQSIYIGAVPDTPCMSAPVPPLGDGGGDIRLADAAALAAALAAAVPPPSTASSGHSKHPRGSEAAIHNCRHRRRKIRCRSGQPAHPPGLRAPEIS